MPALEANASSTVALFPGGIASAIAFKREIRPFEGVSLRIMIIFTLTGGLVGALLLLFTPSRSFDVVVPWLLLFGTIVFAGGRQMAETLKRIFRVKVKIVIFCQFLLGVYGGYFGGAVGIMMMAVWSLFGIKDVKVINANKTLFVSISNTIAVVLFIIAGKIWWMETSVMIAGTVLGGHTGARFVRKIHPNLLRIGIIIFNIIITALFFMRAYDW